MAVNHKTPIHVTYTNDTPTGISEFQSATNECIPVDFGGTGQSDVNRGEVIVGDITDLDFKAKKFTDTSGNLTCVFDETWLDATGQPVNQTTSASTQFYVGETIYQGVSIGTAVASGVIIETTGISSTFKIKAVTGTFTSGSVVWGETSVHESGARRESTLVSTSEAITEQSTLKFYLGTINETVGEYVIDCGTM